MLTPELREYVYALDIHVNGDFEVFNICKDSVDGIIDDLKSYKERSIVKKEEDKVSIIKENSEVLYYYNKSDRSKKIFEMLGASK